MGGKVGGGGKGKYDLGQNSDINVTPFVDILLVLLIIFMVAIPMATVAIKVDLPPAIDQPPPEHPKKPVYLSIGQGGKLFLVDVPIQTAYVAAALAKEGILPADSVMLRADGDVTYEQFMTVLNQLQTDGYYKVGLISEDVSVL